MQWIGAAMQQPSIYNEICPLITIVWTYMIKIFIKNYAHGLCFVLFCYGQIMSLQWRHNGHDGVSNHLPHDCLLNRLFGHKWKKTAKLRLTGLCEGNSPGTGEFPAQRASIAEKVSIWWRHHGSSSFNVWSSSRFSLGLWKRLPQYHISNIEQYGWIIYLNPVAFCANFTKHRPSHTQKCTSL